MFLLDVNVLVAAHREDHVHHQYARPWLDQLLAGDEPFTVPTSVWASFLRLATHPRIFNEPSTLDEAWAFVDTIRAQPHHLTVAPGPRHLTVLRELCESADIRGDLVPDAVLAAMAIEHGCTVATLDRDFARFESVPHIRLRTR